MNALREVIIVMLMPLVRIQLAPLPVHAMKVSAEMAYFAKVGKHFNNSVLLLFFNYCINFQSLEMQNLLIQQITS